MSRPHISELVHCTIWTISAIYLDRTNRAELRQAKRSDPCWITWVVNELTTWEDITYLKSSSSVEAISALLYGQVNNDPVPLALFVTLATQPSNVFYRALVPFHPSVIRIIPSIIRQFIQRNAAHFVRVKDKEHPKNLTSQILDNERPASACQTRELLNSFYLWQVVPIF